MNDVTIIRKYKLIAKLREAFVPSQRDRTFHGTDRVATDNNCMVCFRCFGVSSASMSPCSCQTTIVVVWVNVATGADCLFEDLPGPLQYVPKLVQPLYSSIDFPAPYAKMH